MTRVANQSRPRTAALAIVPLAVIAAGLFFAPILLHSRGLEVISPWEDGPSELWAEQLVAALFAAVTGVCWWRRRAPGTWLTVLATAGIAACAYPVLEVIWFLRLAEGAVVYSAAWSAVVLGALVLAFVAWRRAGWARWMWMVAAYGLQVSVYACPRVPGAFNQFPSGMVFVVADALLIFLAGCAVVGQEFGEPAAR